MFGFTSKATEKLADRVRSHNPNQRTGDEASCRLRTDCKHMNFHAITIWTTLTALIASIIAPYVVAPFAYGLSPYQAFSTNSMVLFPILVVFAATILWLLSGSPLLVSYIIAKKLKSFVIPNLVLLVSTIAFCIYSVYSWIMAIAGGGCMSGLFVVSIASCSVLWMLPAWIVALKLNSWYTKKTVIPEIAEPHEATTAP